jgi:hypothetical protein
VGDTRAGAEHATGSCGDDGSNENVYYVVPGSNGTLVVTLATIAGSDPTLYATADACTDGAPLGCADTTGPGESETLTLEAIAGEPLWVFASTAAPGSYSLTLHMSAGVPGDTCPGQAITISSGADVEVVGDTSIATANYKGLDECAAGASTKEIVYAVTATTPGLLTVTMASNFDGVLYARAGSCTTGAELACSDAESGGGVESITVFIDPSEKVSVFADGAMGSAGKYALSFHLE